MFFEQLYDHLINKQNLVTLKNRNFITKINNDNKKNRFKRVIDDLYQQKKFVMITNFVDLSFSIRFSIFFHDSSYISFYVFLIDEFFVFFFMMNFLFFFIFVINDFFVERFVSKTSRDSNSIKFSTKNQIILQIF